MDGDWPVVVYESPHRIKDTILLVTETYGSETMIFLGRELTKIHEECLSGKAKQLYEKLRDIEMRGEIVLIINPGSDSSQTYG